MGLEIILLTPAYEVSAVDRQGAPVLDEPDPPAVISIFYNEDYLTEQGFSEDDVQRRSDHVHFQTRSEMRP